MFIGWIKQFMPSLHEGSMPGANNMQATKRVFMQSEQNESQKLDKGCRNVNLKGGD